MVPLLGSGAQGSRVAAEERDEPPQDGATLCPWQISSRAFWHGSRRWWRGPLPDQLLPGSGSCFSPAQVIQVPQGKYKVLPTERTKVSSYPVALIPGQFQEYYKRWEWFLTVSMGCWGLRPLEPIGLALTSHALSQVRVRAPPPGSGGNSLQPGFAFRRSVCS